ncbi:MAG: APC family permease [Acidobacteria bacterium]|nr:APC family permease [Acidobacteriota bacterium]
MTRSPDVQVVPRRVLGFRDLVLFYVVTGISLRWIATAAAAGPASVLIWIAAWLAFYLPLVFSVLELSSRYPSEGGLYVWSDRAFGKFSGFMAAWTYWTSNLPYFPAVLYFAAGNALFLGGGGFTHLQNDPGYYMAFSLLALALVTAMNIVGLDVGKWLHNLGALGMWLPILMVLLLGGMVASKFGSATEFSFASMTPRLELKEIIFWSTIAFAFGGCETASFLGDEIQHPRRNIPRALLVSGVLVTLGYIGGTIAVLALRPQDEGTGLLGMMQAIEHGAGRLGLVLIVPVAALLIALSNLGAAGAFLAAAARLPFVAGIDRFLPAAFGRLHARWGTPHVALLVQFFAGAVFVLLGQAGTTVKGAYDVLVSLGVITYFVPYLYVFASLIRVQTRAAGQEVIRVPGGRPVATILGMLGFTTTTIAIALSFVPPADEPNQALAAIKIAGGTALLLGLGAALYWLGRRRAGYREAPAAES